MKKLLKGVGIFFILLIIIIVAIPIIVPKIVDKDHNKVIQPPPYHASTEATELYQNLDFIADMHCDALLWDRDLLKDNDYGHVDIPKMRQANIAIQAFTIVTKSPKGQNFDANTGESDNITMLYAAQGRPTLSLTKRALLQCKSLYEFANKSDGQFFVITSKKELQEYLKKRAINKDITAGFLGVEGAHALDGDIDQVQVLYNHGVRMMAPTHFFDNKLGGSAHGVSGEGLTAFGSNVIKKMEELQMIIDLAHCSPKMIDDIIDMTSVPLVSSHTGVKGTCDNVRNLSDKHLKAIADSGGLISIAMFEQASCGEDAKAVAKAIQYTIDLVGAEHVALGSDFDGSVTTPFNITGLPLIVEELLKLGIAKEDIQMIMGENVKRFLLKNLPEE